MKLVGAMRLCECQDADLRQAVLVQDGYSFLVKQRSDQPVWQSGCALEIRVSRMVLSQSALTREPVLTGESFTLLSDCLFHLSSVYGLADEGWWPFPHAVGMPAEIALQEGEAA